MHLLPGTRLIESSPDVVRKGPKAWGPVVNLFEFHRDYMGSLFKGY